MAPEKLIAYLTTFEQKQSNSYLENIIIQIKILSFLSEKALRGDPKTILVNTSGSVCYTTAPCQVGVVSQMS